MKKIILVLICLLLTGCYTEVVIKIDEEKVSETIKISELKIDAYSNDILREDISSNLKVFEREYEFYDITEYEKDGYVGKTYKLTENIALWAELSHVRPCYEMFQLEKTETNISLNTSDEYRCGYLFGANDVTLIVESDLDLISSNADQIQGNRLIWYINDSNYKNKSINFNYEISNFDNTENLYTMYVVIFIIIIALFVGIYIYKKNRESNKL